MNTAVALSVVYEFINIVNSKETLDKPDIKDALEFMNKTNEVLGLIDENKDKVPKEVIKLAKDRLKARKDKDFETSDKLRDEIKSLGYEIKDDKS